MHESTVLDCAIYMHCTAWAALYHNCAAQLKSTRLTAPRMGQEAPPVVACTTNMEPFIYYIIAGLGVQQSKHN